jgi:class 3 adenylate cyclase
VTNGAHRKVVTVLFCDVVGSTALGESVDPEALQALLARYFERMKAIVESHGGTVEKFIGDAVMAVFGGRSRTRTTRSARAGPRSRCVTRCRSSASKGGSASTRVRCSPEPRSGSLPATP